MERRVFNALVFVLAAAVGALGVIAIARHYPFKGHELPLLAEGEIIRDGVILGAGFAVLRAVQAMGRLLFGPDDSPAPPPPRRP